MTVTIYHNPNCSKSRKTLALLHERGVSPTVVEYLDNPPDAAALREILALLALRPRELMRTKETIYTTLGLEDPALHEDDLIAAMASHPILIERPIVVSGDAAVIGRPPENIHALLDK